MLAGKLEARADAVAALVVVVRERKRGAAVVLGLLWLSGLAAEIPCAEVHGASAGWPAMNVASRARVANAPWTSGVKLSRPPPTNR